MTWKSTYAYYDKKLADKVFKGLKREEVAVKLTSRKLSAHERKLHLGSTRLYTIHRWRL